ncbi:MAG TPA: hypothetical protein D7H88_05470 [Candidatus Poseidoniales archaeon]|nr:MAG TPA: hypothetical protein D7H88_05470 [Candidatus Poseidoniales archaeon]
MFSEGFFHHPDIFVQMVDFNVQVACFHDGFPKEEEEEKHHKKHKCSLHHIGEIETSGEIRVVLVKEYLCPNQSVPHDQERDGMDAHDWKQHQRLVGKPAPADNGHKHLEKLETIDGQHTINSGNFGITSVPKFT